MSNMDFDLSSLSIKNSHNSFSNVIIKDIKAESLFSLLFFSEITLSNIRNKGQSDAVHYKADIWKV